MLFAKLNPQLMCQAGEYLQEGISHDSVLIFSSDNARGWEQTERDNIHISFLDQRPADLVVNTSVSKE